MEKVVHQSFAYLPLQTLLGIYYWYVSDPLLSIEYMRIGHKYIYFMYRVHEDTR